MFQLAPVMISMH